jgi:UDP-N-acetylmuramoyl-tripeptide--D-alanyl-D-alanine ligase
MMDFWTPEGIRNAIGGAGAAGGVVGWTVRGDAEPIDGVGIDSRTLAPGQAFIAIKGATHDGHDFLVQAAARGAAMLIVDRALTAGQVAAIQAAAEGASPVGAGASTAVRARGGLSILRVADTGAALLRLAGAYRRTLERTRVIAVGGSNGKTTTTRMIQACLSRVQRGTASQKSFNNAVGVPLTILSARRGDQFLVCEVGTNAPGEIAALTRVVEPDIAVITSIGREHLEGLGSIRGVVQEEVSLLAGLRPGGVAVISADSPLLVDAVRPGAMGADAPGVVTFGVSEKADLRATQVVCDATGVSFKINGRHALRTALLGAHNASNAAAAVGVARRLGLDWAEIAAGLLAVERAPMRLEPVDESGVWFLNDAYNANPESMLAAIETFCAITREGAHARRVVVVGDMLELGAGAPEAHEEMGVALAAAAAGQGGGGAGGGGAGGGGAGGGGGLDLVVLVGPLMGHAARAMAGAKVRCVHEATPDDAAMARVASLLRAGDAVLLKGSRGTRVERVLQCWREACRGAAATPTAALAAEPAVAPAAEPKPAPTIGVPGVDPARALWRRRH